MAPIQIKRGSSPAWTAINPILLDGEPGYALPSGPLKIGDGSRRWLELPAAGGGGGGGGGDLTRAQADQLYVAFSPDGVNQVIKPPGDSRLAVVNWINDSEVAGTWLFHLTTTVNTSGGVMAIGVDGKGTGILIRNKATGIGFRLEQLASITSASAKGIAIEQRSSVADALFAEQYAGGDAPLASFISYNSSPTVAMVRFQGANTKGGSIRADTGALQWSAPIELYGGRIDARTDNGTPEASRPHTYIDVNGIEIAAPTGTANSWYTSKIARAGQQLQFQIGSGGALGGVNMETVIAIQQGAVGAKRLGFFGATPALRPARPTDLSSVIAALATLGLTA